MPPFVFSSWLPAPEAPSAHGCAPRAAQRPPVPEAQGWIYSRRRRGQGDRARLHTLKVGDVLYTSWGYEQTNVEFYEVVAVRGHAVDMQEVAQDRIETYSMQGTCRAVRGQFIGAIIRGKRPNSRNAIRITSYSSAHLWDGHPIHWSSYA